MVFQMRVLETAGVLETFIPNQTEQPPTSIRVLMRPETELMPMEASGSAAAVLQVPELPLQELAKAPLHGPASPVSQMRINCCWDTSAGHGHQTGTSCSSSQLLPCSESSTQDKDWRSGIKGSSASPVASDHGYWASETKVTLMHRKTSSEAQGSCSYSRRSAAAHLFSRAHIMCSPNPDKKIHTI